MDKKEIIEDEKTLDKTEEPGYNFEEVMKKNKAKKAKAKEQQAKNNKATLRSYRIKS